MMTCEEVRALLDDYLDGSLSSTEQAQVRKHLGECVPCRREFRELGILIERARALGTDVQPERNLWPEIERRIVKDIRPIQDRPTSRPGLDLPWWTYVAAAGLVLLALSLPLTIKMATRQAIDPDRSVGVAPLAPLSQLLAKAELARSQDGVLHARTDLLETVERQRGFMDPETIEVVEQNVRIIDQAIGEIRQALEDHPDNRRLYLQLAARYQQEMNLLKRVKRI